jgi:hypothetical protein
MAESGPARPRSGTAGRRPVASVPVYFANWPTRACQNFLAPLVTGHSANLSPTAPAPHRGTRAAAKDHVDRIDCLWVVPVVSLASSIASGDSSLPRLTDIMLSSLRIASRRVAVTRNFAAVRAASTWANVPQGPPVRRSPLLPLPIEIAWLRLDACATD